MYYISLLADMMHWEGGGWLWMTLMMILWALIAIVVVFFLVRYFSSQGSLDRDNAEKQETPLDVAKRRYAAGEINHDEFQAIANNLKKT